MKIKKGYKISNNGDDDERDYEGPPTSCKTLTKLGYTLNGYYLIKGNDQQSKSDKKNKIQVVFCRFKHAKFPEKNPHSKQVLEVFNDFNL